jgi:hypothetical protein
VNVPGFAVLFIFLTAQAFQGPEKLIKCSVLGFDSDSAMGPSQAMVDEYAKGAGVSVGEDLSQVATFGAGMFADEGYAIVDSATNDTVFRGTLRWGGKGLQGDIEMMHA